MLFIGGISQGRKLLNYARSILCGSCGSTSQCQVFMTYMYFSFFFIPLFKWNKRFYVQMSCCSAIYELEPEIGKAILRGEEPAITSADLHLVQEGLVDGVQHAAGGGGPHGVAPEGGAVGPGGEHVAALLVGHHAAEG